MSEKKEENKNQGNLWTTSSTVISAIAALTVAIVGVLSFCRNQTPSNNAATSTQNPTNTPASSSSETTSSKFLHKLVVQAKKSQGESYFNSEDKPVNIKFKTTGQWRIISENAAGYEWVKSNQLSTKYISPNGFSNLNENSKSELKNLPCSEYTLRALVVVVDGAKKRCLTSGEKGTFPMEKGQTVYFVMNDNDYSDNDGEVTVELTSANQTLSIDWYVTTSKLALESFSKPCY
jgi:hypothetical protein